MPGKFLRRAAIVDTVKSEHRINAIRRRDGLTRHPITVTVCGCPDLNCGAWHTIRPDRLIPTAEQAIQDLAEDKRIRKLDKRYLKLIRRRGRAVSR